MSCVVIKHNFRSVLKTDTRGVITDNYSLEK